MPQALASHFKMMRLSSLTISDVSITCVRTSCLISLVRHLHRRQCIYTGSDVSVGLEKSSEVVNRPAMLNCPTVDTSTKSFASNPTCPLEHEHALMSVAPIRDASRRGGHDSQAFPPRLALKLPLLDATHKPCPHVSPRPHEATQGPPI